jgi:hypothetical protein
MKRVFVIFAAALFAIGCNSESQIAGELTLGGPYAGKAVLGSVQINAVPRTKFSEHINSIKAGALPQVLAAIKNGADCENKARGSNAPGSSAERTELCRIEEANTAISVFDQATSNGLAPQVSASTGPDGKFTLKLPAGEYMIVALIDGMIDDPKFLFIRPVIIDGTTKSITLNENDLAEPASIAEMFR